MRIKLSPWTLWTLAVLLGVALSASWSGLNMGLARTDPPAVAPSMVKAGDSVQVLYLGFTPPVGVAKNIVQAIDQAKQEVLVQAYGFTHNAIAQAVVRAHQRGAKVQVLLDAKSESTNQYVLTLFKEQGVTVRHDGAHAIAHNKVIVIDSQVVVTGSFNFTNSAETRNAENLLILSGVSLAQAYRENWLSHWAHARP
jgi:phosphatidylserine/phosphatidylglycerophosphate/cardiolipin synthase-like enzyme